MKITEKLPPQWTGVLLGEMHNHGITLQQIADELCVRKSYISMIMRGERQPKDAQERLETAFENILARRK